MPNPKRRHSPSRKGKRRAHDALSLPAFSVCSNCGTPKLPHRACPACGYYRGRQGIGEAIALERAKEGPLVFLVDIQREKLEAVAEKIVRNGGRASVQPADVSRFDQASDVVEKIVRENARLDYVVNNAGITRDNLLFRMREEEWDAGLAVNLKGVFNFSRAAIRTMISNRFGRIVHISSVVGVMGNAGQANYSASKAGVIGLTKSLAR